MSNDVINNWIKEQAMTKPIIGIPSWGNVKDDCGPEMQRALCNMSELSTDSLQLPASDMPQTVYENRGGKVWQRHADGRRELFAEDTIKKLTALEKQLAEARAQTDRLVEALERIIVHEECDSRGDAFTATEANDALDALKGADYD